ncbi:MAG: hypothetical protein MUO25_03285, partial [Thermoanaerobaculaceae bacterium]|nr:hypothetical protein [Thermoanaerobaculaceae bacterium]
VETEIAALESPRLALVRAEEEDSKKLLAQRHAAERRQLTDLLEAYTLAEQRSQELLAQLLQVVRVWDVDHPGCRVTFVNGHAWMGAPLHWDRGEAERALLKPLDGRVAEFNV